MALSPVQLCPCRTEIANGTVVADRRVALRARFARKRVQGKKCVVSVNVTTALIPESMILLDVPFCVISLWARRAHSRRRLVHSPRSTKHASIVFGVPLVTPVAYAGRVVEGGMRMFNGTRLASGKRVSGIHINETRVAHACCAVG